MTRIEPQQQEAIAGGITRFPFVAPPIIDPGPAPIFRLPPVEQ